MLLIKFLVTRCSASIILRVAPAVLGDDARELDLHGRVIAGKRVVRAGRHDPGQHDGEYSKNQTQRVKSISQGNSFFSPEESTRCGPGNQAWMDSSRNARIDSAP